MGMSAWGFFIAPALIAADPSVDTAQRDAALADFAATAPQESMDVFSELASIAGVTMLDDRAMSSASGGANVAVDISNLGVNAAENSGSVSDITTNNTTTGQISNNYVTDNGGITTVFNNTGNGVVMQSIVNLNIFLQGAGPSQ